MRIRIRAHHFDQTRFQLHNQARIIQEVGCEKLATPSSSSNVITPSGGFMNLPKSLSAPLYFTQRLSSTGVGMETPRFNPKRVLILSKLTRYEFEKKVNRGASDAQLQSILKRRGSDYENLLVKHKIHHSYLNTLQNELKNAGVESRLVRRFAYTQEAVDWADAIFSAGGDGTFLMASSKVRSATKPVIGINTDPQGSEGYMCLIRKLPEEHLKPALKRLFKGDFNWLHRQRIRITVSGDQGVDDAVELHDQQLNRDPSTTRWGENPRTSADQQEECMMLNPPARKSVYKLDDGVGPIEKVTVELPVLALNEVFVGESLSSRVSYYEIGVDDEKMVKQKSSGITICTGTGSTSWYFNINKLTEQCVSDLLKIVADKCHVNLDADNKELVSDICTKFNQQLIFNPDDRKMAFSVRDPVFNATFPPTDPRGFASKIRIKSRGYDAHLVIDGGISYRFNDGSEAVMEVLPDDALKTVVFR